jgi:hypothetical protein
MNFDQIKQKISESYTADFGTVFNDSINLFKLTWVQGFLWFLFYMLFAFVFVMVLTIPLIALFGSFAGIADSNKLQGLSFLLIVLLVLFFIVFFIMLITVVNGLLGGLYIIYKKADNDEEYSANDFFTLLKKDRILKTFKISLAFFGIILLGYIACFLPVIYLAIPLSYIIVVYAYNQELTVTEIIKLAFALGNKNWFVSFGLQIVCAIVAYIGAIFTCGIGFLFTFAFVLIPHYFIYKQAIGFSEQSEIDSIGETNEVF